MRVEGLGFDPYRAQVSVGGFLTARNPLYSLLEGYGYGLFASFRKKPIRILPCAEYWDDPTSVFCMA